LTGAGTRRSLFRLGLAGLAALAAHAIGRPASVEAATGGNFILGQANTASATTQVSTTSGRGLEGDTSDAGASGVFGQATATTGTPAGVYGTASADLGTGVWGVGALTVTSNSTGVYGDGDVGVQGFGSIGTMGTSDAGTGLYGFSGLAALPAAPGHVGIFGASSYNDGYGVWGRNVGSGYGLLGESSSGIGLRADSTAGYGGFVSTNTGTAIYAIANAAGGTALQVNGPAKFSRSGIATVAGGTSSVAVSSVPLSASSLVLATPQLNVAGLYVQAVVPNIAGSSFTIYLSKAVPGATPVAWFVAN
jgi:hypothetical protein